MPVARAWIGTSGWRYPPWRGVFYPPKLPQRRELAHLAALMNSVEINGSFYSLQRPGSYRAWAAETPDDFVFAVKGSRYITHMKQLRDVRVPLANFLASGLLALGPKLGPLLWQLPPRLRFDAERIDEFLTLLPRSTGAAAQLAGEHDARLDGRAETTTDVDRPLRHALEVRHESFRDPAFVALLRAHDVALVVADTAGTFPRLEDVTAGFVYVRLHGDTELYTSGYSTAALDGWAALVRAWLAGESPVGAYTVAPPAAGSPRDVFVYFDSRVVRFLTHGSSRCDAATRVRTRYLTRGDTWSDWLGSSPTVREGGGPPLRLVPVAPLLDGTRGSRLCRPVRLPCRHWSPSLLRRLRDAAGTRAGAAQPRHGRFYVGSKAA